MMDAATDAAIAERSAGPTGSTWPETCECGVELDTLNAAELRSERGCLDCLAPSAVDVLLLGGRSTREEKVVATGILARYLDLRGVKP